MRKDAAGAPPIVRIEASPRRGLSRAEAARFVGVGLVRFDHLVATGRMPDPLVILGRRVWDLKALDEAFDALRAGSREETDEEILARLG